MKDAEIRSLTSGERQRFVRYVRSIFRDRSDMDAEDVVQDVLIRILERKDSGMPLENLTAYIFRSLKNRVIDQARTRKPMMSLDAETEDGGRLIDLLKDQRPDALAVLESREGKQELFEALEILSEIERDVVIAHEFEGTSFKEMSDAWKIPQNTLLSHKARAMKKLKSHFQRS